VFRDFLKCEYSEENILFWLACEELKKESNPEVVEEKARFIYEDYISILSPKEVRILVSLINRIKIFFLSNMRESLNKTNEAKALRMYATCATCSTGRLQTYKSSQFKCTWGNNCLFRCIFVGF